MRHRNIRRADHHHFHGWVVEVKRRGRATREYVRDGAYGGRAEALRQAVKRRDAIEAALPPATKIHTRSKVSNTGTVGVAYVLDRNPGGVTARYVAIWTELSGQKRKRSFSVGKYGKRLARALAIEEREAAVERILSARGARVWWHR